MQTTAHAQQTEVAEVAGDGIESTSGRSRWPGIAMMTGSALSNQLGAATASLAFPVIGPVGVVAVRQWVAGIFLLTVGRPRIRSFTWSQWWPILLLAAVFGTMNLSLYTAIDRLGLGLAVTLEFLGPLSVALAGSRRRKDLGCALVAAMGVAVLARPQPTTDYAGIALGLLAATCWASYILLNRVIGQRLPGTEGSACAAGLSAVLFIPVGVAVLVRHPPTIGALGCAAAAGVLSSAVPMLADLFALRRVPTGLFGIFMSVNPVLAALVGLVVLDQTLGWTQWLAVAAIVTANAMQGALPSAKRVAGRAAGSAETHPLQPEVEQFGVADDLDSRAVGGEPLVDDEQEIDQRSAHGDCGLLVRPAPGDDLAGEVYQPFRGGFRRGVGCMEMQGAAGAQQFAGRGMDLEEHRQ